ncbi:MAG TPA: diguanylate cyclase [Solirubrobacteraceae bacterium]|nr:diguanylate cyclase [Solirubrobacteraceae bacterium]
MRFRRGLPKPFSTSTNRKPVIAIFLTFALISAGTVALSVGSTKHSEHRTSVIEIAARQRTLAERFVEEVLLAREGVRADPGYTAQAMTNSATALIGGGVAPAVNGDDDETALPPAESGSLRAQFELDDRLVDDLIATGQAVAARRPTARLAETGGEHVAGLEPLQRLRVLAALTSSVAFRAAREIGRTDESATGDLITMQVLLGIGGLVITVLLAGMLLATTRRQSAHFRSLALSSSDLVIVLGADGCRYVSRNVAAMTGLTAQELYGDGVMQFVREEDRAVLERVRTTAEPAEFTFQLRNGAGEWRHLEARATDLRNDRSLRGVVLHARDTTDRMALERTLQEQLQRDGFATKLSEALEMADDEREVFEVVEHAMSNISERTPMELLLSDSSRAHLARVASAPGTPAPGCPVKSPFSCVAVRRGTAVVFDSSEALNACPHLRDRPSGSCSAVCVPVSFMGRALGVLHTTGPDRNALTEEPVARLTALAGQAGARIGTVRAFEKTQLQASTDGLTGLINRRTAEQRLRELVRAGDMFALVLADLDHFKALNDTHGHEAGDRALRLFSQSAAAALRERDILARWGGEEFVIALPELDRFQAVAVLERVRHDLAVAHPGETPRFTASFGVTDSLEGDSVERLLAIADAGLYAAKHAGRDRVTIGDPEAIAKTSGSSRARLESEEETANGGSAGARASMYDAAAHEEEPRPSGVEIR